MNNQDVQTEAQLPSASVLPFFFIGFVLLAFLTFGASISYGFMTIDDPYLITSNLAVRGLTFQNLHRVFTTFDPELYIPLTFVSYQLNYLMTGLNATSFHVTNILLHAINGLLLSWLLLGLTKNRWLSIFGGLLWLVHPLNTEAVVWTAGRKDLLSAFFYLLSFNAYLQTRTHPSKVWRWVSIGAFVLGLLSKVMILTLPFTFLLYEWLWERRSITIASVKDKLLYFVPAALLAAVALFAKQRVIGSSSIVETVLMACRSAIFYLQKIFVPINLSVFYPHEGAIGLLMPIFLFSFVCILTLSILALTLYRKLPIFTFCWFAYLLTLGPTFLNFHKGEVVFFAVDRYPYLASLYIILLALLCVEWLRQRIRYASSIAVILGVLLLGSSTYASRIQTALWSADDILFSHALNLYPSSISARSSLAMIYQQTGHTDEALAVLKAGLAYKQDVSLLVGIGSLYAAQGRSAEAKEQYAIAMKVDPKNPEPYFFFGSLLEGESKFDEAIQQYQQAISLDDSYVAAHNNLASIEQERGNLVQAEKHFRKALSYNPDFFEGQYNLFQVLELQKKYDEAFPYLERAYQLNPDDIDILRGIVYRYSERGENNKAALAAKHALTVFPNDPSVARFVDYLRGKGIDVQ